MNIDAPEIVALRAKVSTADEEFHVAMACHEAWKPAAYDRDLHQRLGTSYAANTFKLIRQVLRREMVLALWRLWDNDTQAIRLGAIANALGNKRIMDALASACAAQWGNHQPLVICDNIPAEDQADFVEALRQSDIEFGRQQGEKLRLRATEAIEIIRRYQEGGERHATLETLTTLRHQQLAHRQVNRTAIDTGDPDTFDERIEAFYQDMSKLIHLLRLVVENVSYNPEETAEIFHKNATLFWAGVRGERTEGHPNYTR
jgi:hypothetical protein